MTDHKKTMTGKCNTWKMSDGPDRSPGNCNLVRHFHGIAFDRACIFSRPDERDKMPVHGLRLRCISYQDLDVFHGVVIAGVR